MARFLIGTMPLTGHVNPGLPIARKLVERGHEVRWYTGRKFQGKIEATGAEYVPMETALDFDEYNLEPNFPGLAKLQGLAALKYGAKHLFLDAGPRQLTDYQKILNEFPADVLLSDTAFVGAIWASEKIGIPWAVFGITALTLGSRDTAPFGLGMLPSATLPGQVRNALLYQLFNRVIIRDLVIYHDHARGKVGLPPVKKSPFDAAVSPYLYLQGTTQAFEYPRNDLPQQVNFIGPVLPGPAPDFEPPEWWDELSGDRPVIHVTQGTASTDNGELIVPTLKALAHEDVLVVATTGGKPIETLKLDPLPANARVASFIPHYHLLPHVDVMVTNGGYGGVQTALGNGVPLVAAGQTEEKPEICQRIAWSGAGINLRARRPSEASLRAAVRRILTDSSYKHKAEAIQADFNSHDAPSEAAALLERLAETKQPVYRHHD